MFYLVEIGPVEVIELFVLSLFVAWGIGILIHRLRTGKWRILP
jgi:hypothetical protein